MGAGGSGRNTTIIRSNYLTPEGSLFYEASVKLYESLSQELNFNTMFSQHGHLTLAHSDRSVNTMMERAEVNRLVGVDSRVVYPDEIKELCPQLDTTEHPDLPDPGRALPPAGRHHPPRRGGVGLRQGGRSGWAPRSTPTPRSPASTRRGGKVTGVETNRGTINAGTVISCVAGWSTRHLRDGRTSRCR